MTRTYFDPGWHEFNLGLVKITEPHLRKGPFEAKGLNHLMHEDDPHFVALEVLELLDKLYKGGLSRL